MNTCEKHRDEKGRQPGICPSCLRERLAQLTADRSSTASSTVLGGLSSPRASCHLRHGSDVVPDFAGAVGEALRKSNSMTSASGDESMLNQQKKKKKKGFWSRLTKMRL